jgi:uncharacterized cupredoxin-like copper-binding protein
MLFVPDVATVAKGEQIRFQLKNEGELDPESLVGTAQTFDGTRWPQCRATQPEGKWGPCLEVREAGRI